MTRSVLMTGGAAIVAGLLASAAACAQEVRPYQIPPGPLADALMAYGAQSGRQIFFASALTDGRTSPGLSGRHTPAAALDRLLEGTGLVWSEGASGAVFVRAGAAAEPAELEAVVVTGTLLRTPGTATSPLVVLDRDDLDRRAQGTVADILTSLPQNYAGSGTAVGSLGFSDPTGQGSTGMGASVNLRGLGADATLTLVDGRRLAGAGSMGELADISTLPSAAVERVDILLDGASALYGSDAVAGVVNVVMRRSFDGMESRVRLAAAQGGAEDVMASHLAGRSWSSGSALLSYEYQRLKPLNALDRPYSADGDLRPFGGTSQGDIFAAPGNIVVYDPVARAYAVQYAIRPQTGGVATGPGDFVAGAVNRAPTLLGADLSPDIERHSLYGRIRQSVGDRLDLSADLRFNRRDWTVANSPAATYLTVTAANPHFVSPVGAASHTVAYSFYGDLGNPRRIGRNRSVGVTLGARYALTDDWTLDGYLAVADERAGRDTVGLVNSAFLGEALGARPDSPDTNFSTARDGFFNPFGSGDANPAAVLDFVGSGYSRIVDRGRSEAANLMLRGPALDLPGGAVETALGIEYRREGFATRYEALTSTTAPVFVATPMRRRAIAALFGEVRAPLFGPDNARPGLRSLELSAAGRLEEHDDFGSTANPKIGLAWSPIERLTVRTSYGTSFRAPAMTQLYADPVVAVVNVPRADGARILSLYRYGGNPDLKPETATTWTAGLDYSGDRIRLSLGLFDTRFSDRVGQPVNENLEGVLIDPGLAPFVQRVDPAANPADLALVRSYTQAPGFAYAGLYPDTAFGAILDARWVNAASVDVRGVDFTAATPLRFGEHAVDLDASASWIADYRVQTTTTSPEQSRVGQVGFPVRLRARLGGTWSWRTVSAGLHWNHVASYADARGRGIDAWDTADARVEWALPVRRGVRLALSVQNLFDADPPFYDSAIGLGFDAGQANPFGRIVALRLIQRW
jgi:iron complex outermembrane receptor protein